MADQNVSSIRKKRGKIVLPIKLRNRNELGTRRGARAALRSKMNLSIFSDVTGNKNRINKKYTVVALPVSWKVWYS